MSYLDNSMRPLGDEREQTTQQRLHQWFTPAWAAEAIVESEFGWLEPGHRVVEPSCGDGSVLCAIPAYVDAIGVEIDPEQAERARAASGRQVIVGDFLRVPVQDIGAATVHAVIGNPPFSSDAVAGFLKKSHELLVQDGQVGLILPAYILQTSSKVSMLSSQFSIKQQMLPRDLFPGLKLPLVFATFKKEVNRRLFGFLLYKETLEIRAINKPWKDAVINGREPGGVWMPVVQAILAAMGGSGTLEDIYAAVQAKRPTANAHWRAKIRQTLGRHPSRFHRVEEGCYRLAEVGMHETQLA